VAKTVGVSEATVSQWESGSIENMKRDRIALYAKALQNIALADENYDVLPTIQQNNDVGTILTARIPKDKIDELITAESA